MWNDVCIISASYVRHVHVDMYNTQAQLLHQHFLRSHMILYCTTLQCCEYCQVVVHQWCARYTHHDCKPLAVDSKQPVHDWRPAGVVMPIIMVRATRSVSCSSDTACRTLLHVVVPCCQVILVIQISLLIVLIPNHVLINPIHSGMLRYRKRRIRRGRLHLCACTAPNHVRWACLL